MKTVKRSASPSSATEERSADLAAEKEVLNKRGVAGWLNPYHYNLERWAYVFQRVTGCLDPRLRRRAHRRHKLLRGRAFRLGPERGQLGLDMAATENIIGHVILVMVVLVVVFHGINGMRLILSEYGLIFEKPSRPDYPYRAKSLRAIQRHLIWVAIVAAILAALWTGRILFG